MSSSYKGFWINGSKETGYTAEQWRNGNALVGRHPTLATVKRAIVRRLAVTYPCRVYSHGVERVMSVAIEEITEDRVKGLRWARPFDVKHDKKKFTLGSGSGKITLHFNEDKSPINV